MSKNSSFSLKRIFSITIFASGTFAWWFLITIYFEDIYPNFVDNQFWISVLALIFYGSGAISTIPGSMIGERVNQNFFLFFCFIFGIFSALLTFFVGQNLFFAILTSCLLGISIGLGFPNCMAVITDSTSRKESARFMSVFVLETFILIFFGIMIVSQFEKVLFVIIVVGVVIRSSGFFGFLVKDYGQTEELGGSWFSILRNKNLIYYLLPWLAFNLAGELVYPIWQDLFNTTSWASYVYNLGNPIRMVAIAIFAPIAGIIADRFGRKPIIIFALVTLGIGFGLLGLDNRESVLFFYLLVSGVAWALLMVSYFALFGDIASLKSSEKYYAIGLSTPLIAYALVRGILPIFSITRVQANILSPIMSILLFLAIIPVLYVKDTLSEAMIQERKLKEHTEKVGRLVRESENK
jgi:MFS family permease